MSDKQHVLVVDDDPDLVESITMKLESDNYRVSKAYDGIEAWDKIKEERPDLIILDVMMPRKNGYELCDEIKKDSQYKDITVVLLTAVGDAVSTTTYTHWDGKTTLAEDFIPKPITEQKLFGTLQRHLHLNWIYQKGQEDPSKEGVQQVTEPIIPPPKDDIKELYEFAIIGDIMEILDKIRAIELSEPQYGLFAAKLRQLAETLKVSEIQQFLEQYLDR